MSLGLINRCETCTGWCEAIYESGASDKQGIFSDGDLSSDEAKELVIETDDATLAKIQRRGCQLTADQIISNIVEIEGVPSGG